MHHHVHQYGPYNIYYRRFKDLDIESNEGARCWNPGWGSETKDGELSPNLKSIGVNLLDGISCKIRSYWPNLYENEICAVSAPTDTTKINGYGYHVVAGGKDTCSGDNGSPLMCDINGDITLVGVNSRALMNVVQKAILLYMST